MIQRAVPLSSGSVPNAAVQASRSLTSDESAAALVTATASPDTVAAGLTAADNSLSESNICASTSRVSPQPLRPPVMLRVMEFLYRGGVNGAGDHRRNWQRLLGLQDVIQPGPRGRIARREQRAAVLVGDIGDGQCADDAGV